MDRRSQSNPKCMLRGLNNQTLVFDSFMNIASEQPSYIKQKNTPSPGFGKGVATVDHSYRPLLIGSFYIFLSVKFLKGGF